MTGQHKNTSLTRRHALAVSGGTVAVGGLVLAGYQSAFADTTAQTTASASSSATSTGAACMQLMSSVTEGPYYLDGALVRKNITEGKSGVPLTLGYYSGYTTASPGGSVPAEREEGDSANDNTYLRGYQIANAHGVVKFETVFPGWYIPRTCHIHVKVHTGGQKEDGTYEGGKVNYTGQLFFDDDTAEAIFALEPYAKHTGTYTKLADDMVYDGGGASSGLLTLKAVHKKDPSKGYKGSLTLGVDPDAENSGAGSGGGGTPPSGAPSDAPTGTPPSDSASPSASASS